MRPKTVLSSAVWVKTASSICASSCPETAIGSSLSPACLANAATVAGLSPEITLTWIPACRNSARVWAASGRNSSPKYKTPSGITWGGSNGLPDPSRNALTSELEANNSTRNPRSAPSRIRVCRSSDSDTPSSSGAPRRYPPGASAKAIALHLCAEPKGTSVLSDRRALGKAVAIASLVLLLVETLAA